MKEIDGNRDRDRDRDREETRDREPGRCRYARASLTAATHSQHLQLQHTHNCNLEGADTLELRIQFSTETREPLRIVDVRNKTEGGKDGGRSQAVAHAQTHSARRRQQNKSYGILLALPGLGAREKIAAWQVHTLPPAHRGSRLGLGCAI
jgi:hypothetical protein